MLCDLVSGPRVIEYALLFAVGGVSSLLNMCWGVADYGECMFGSEAEHECERREEGGTWEALDASATRLLTRSDSLLFHEYSLEGCLFRLDSLVH